MVKIKLNPEYFKDYDAEKKTSETANKMFFFVGPSSMSFEKALVPFNGGYYGKRNQREMQNYLHCYSGSVPVWATISGQWFTDDEFKLVAQSEAYPDLIMNASKGVIKVEKDGTPYSVNELYEMSRG